MRILFGLLFLMGSAAMAHELNRQPVSAQQIEKAKDLPGTIVIRVNKNNPKDVAVLHLKQKLAKNQRVDKNAPFEQIAVNGEVHQLVFVPQQGKERDATSSTAAWRFGWGGGWGHGGWGHGGWYGGYRGYYGGPYYGGYYPSYYYPSYYYGSYYYPYQPIYSYYDSVYSYSVCGCPSYYCGGYGY